jgi:predicted phosphodiesterase
VKHLSNNKFTPQEIELLKSKEGAYAVIMGYLKAERGKIAPSVFNKLVIELGYPKINRDKLIDYAKEMNEDKDLLNLYTKALNREIKLEDLTYTWEDPEDPVAHTIQLKEEDVFAQVTNFLIDNEHNNARLRELRKLQREGVYMNILMDNLKKHLVEELKGMPRAKYLTTPVPDPQPGDRSLILMFSDWHIGALVFNADTGGYDFVKLRGKVQNAIKQALQIIRDLEIKNVYVFHIGDVQEHIDMRNVNQAFEAEFPATEQIAKAQRLIVDMLMVLSKEVHVTFGMVAGNHDRFSGNKDNKVYNDNSVYVILDTLFLLQEVFGQLPNVTLIDNREDTYEFLIKIAGKNFKVKHGDHEKKGNDVKIPKHIKTEPIDYYIMGHIHTTRIIQEDFARFHVYVGSPMGGNNYSKELNLPTTQGAQLVMVLTEGSDTPWFIPLLDL